MKSDRAALAFSVCAVFGFSAFLVFSPRNFLDLRTYVTAFHDWRQGFPVYQRFLLSSDPRSSFYAYPPFFLLVFAPFANLSPFWLVLCWDLLSLIFLFASVSLLAKIFFPEKKGLFYLKLFACTLFSYPVLFTFMLGQTSLWALFFLSLSLYLLKKGRETLSVFPIAFIGFLKVYPLIYLSLYFSSRNRRTLSALFLFAFLLVAINWAVFPEELKVFISSVLPKRIVPPLFAANQSLEATLGRNFVGDATIRPLLYFPLASTLGRLAGRTFYALFLFYLLFLRRDSLEWRVSFLILASMIFPPLVWVHHYVLLLPLFFHLLREADFLGPLSRFWFKLALLVTYFCWILFSASRLIPFPFDTLVISTPFYALFVLFLLLLFTRKEGENTFPCQ